MLEMPEPPYRQDFRQIASDLDRQFARLTTLTLHRADGPDVVAALAPAWQVLEGRPGVKLFHVPHPSGAPGLFMTVCAIDPGTEFEGTSIDHSQLVALLAGDLECNGQTYRPGQFLWLAPGEPANWKVRAGYLGAVLYDVPPHDIDPDLLPLHPPSL
jgi:hypothetical protein